MSTVFSGDEIAPFFGFIGAAAALVFSCTSLSRIRGTAQIRSSMHSILTKIVFIRRSVIVDPSESFIS